MDRWRTWSLRKSSRFMTWRKSAEPLFTLSTFPWGKLSTLDAEYSTLLRESNVSVLFNQKTQHGTFKICLKSFKYVQSLNNDTDRFTLFVRQITPLRQETQHNPLFTTLLHSLCNNNLNHRGRQFSNSHIVALKLQFMSVCAFLLATGEDKRYYFRVNLKNCRMHWVIISHYEWEI